MLYETFEKAVARPAARKAALALLCSLALAPLAAAKVPGGYVLLGGIQATEEDPDLGAKPDAAPFLGLGWQMSELLALEVSVTGTEDDVTVPTSIGHTLKASTTYGLALVSFPLTPGLNLDLAGGVTRSEERETDELGNTVSTRDTTPQDDGIVGAGLTFTGDQWGLTARLLRPSEAEDDKSDQLVVAFKFSF